MKNFVTILVIGGLAWFAYTRYQSRAYEAIADDAAEEAWGDASRKSERPQSTQTYSCDGRRHCSQMRSCEEATWMIDNCPGMKMDGDRDGIPCEDQWC
jgi:Excalibur calcium-binding domain